MRTLKIFLLGFIISFIASIMFITLVKYATAVGGPGVVNHNVLVPNQVTNISFQQTGE